MTTRICCATCPSWDSFQAPWCCGGSCSLWWRVYTVRIGAQIHALGTPVTQAVFVRPVAPLREQTPVVVLYTRLGEHA